MEGLGETHRDGGSLEVRDMGMECRGSERGMGEIWGSEGCWRVVRGL